MDYVYFRFNAPLGMRRFKESELTADQANHWHIAGKPYTVALFEGERVKWSLYVADKSLGASNEFFDDRGRKDCSYGWERRLVGETVLTLGQVYKFWYSEHESQWRRRMMISLKRNGELWRSCFDRDTQRYAEDVEGGGATEHVITLPSPKFGEYDAFREIRVEPVYSWLQEWPQI